jgi:isopenicillin N synthase-like dioxygenase
MQPPGCGTGICAFSEQLTQRFIHVEFCLRGSGAIPNGGGHRAEYHQPDPKDCEDPDFDQMLPRRPVKSERKGVGSECLSRLFNHFERRQSRKKLPRPGRAVLSLARRVTSRSCAPQPAAPRQPPARQVHPGAILLPAELADELLDTVRPQAQHPDRDVESTQPTRQRKRQMSAAALSPVVAAWDHGRIPVLDLGPYLARDAGAAPLLARAFARAFEDTGFLVIANHGISPRLVADTFAVAAQFFARPEPEKLALKIARYNIGYLPFGGQLVRHSPINKNTKPNFSESFYITRDRAPGHPDIVNNKPLVGLNRWPPNMPEFRAATMAYYAAMEAMTTRLVPLVAMALDLPPDYFSEAFAEPNCTIRLIHYPPHPHPEENEFGFAPHTDNNFLTFLAQSALPGLEVRAAEGAWIRPPAVPGTFVVNTGAMLARYSNDRFRATPHRVTNSNNASRYAIPFFLGADQDSVVNCVPTCVGPGNPPRYEPTTYGAFAQRLLTLNFAHRRADVSREDA